MQQMSSLPLEALPSTMTSARATCPLRQSVFGAVSLEPPILSCQSGRLLRRRPHWTLQDHWAQGANHDEIEAAVHDCACLVVLLARPVSCQSQTCVQGQADSSCGVVHTAGGVI